MITILARPRPTDMASLTDIMRATNALRVACGAIGIMPPDLHFPMRAYDIVADAMAASYGVARWEFDQKAIGETPLLCGLKIRPMA
jgi:hypothetical protein